MPAPSTHDVSERAAFALPRSREIPGSAKSPGAQARAKHERQRIYPLSDRASPARAPRAARNSVLRDGDGGEECLPGRHRIRRIALEQYLAAAAMQESVVPVFARLAGQG